MWRRASLTIHNQRKNQSIIEWMLQSAEKGGAGLTDEQVREASKPDDGGHTPSEIWRMAGGNETVALLLVKRLDVKT